MSEAASVAVTAPIAPPPKTGSERASVQAIVTYWLLGNLTFTYLGVLGLIIFHEKVDPTLLGVLGGLILTVSNLAAGAVGYWLGSSAMSNRQPTTVQTVTTAS